MSASSTDPAPSGADTDVERTVVTSNIDQLTLTVETGDQVVVHLRGELDPHTAPLLQDEIDQLLAGGATAIVLDLSGLGFVDSSGLRVLISAHRQLADLDGTLTLHAPSETARRLLEITGLVDHITITGS